MELPFSQRTPPYPRVAPLTPGPTPSVLCAARSPSTPHKHILLYRACSLSLRRGRPQWYRDLAQARRGAVIMAIRAAAHQRVTPQLRPRSRRCTSAHTKAPDGPGSQRAGPGSSRRRPAAAGRLHRYAPITLRERWVGRQNLPGNAVGPIAILKQRPIGCTTQLFPEQFSFRKRNRYSSVLRSPQSR